MTRVLASLIIDSSALVAIAEDEESRADVLRAIGAAEGVRIGAPTLFAANLVLSRRRGRDGLGTIERLIRPLGIGEIPFDASHRRVAAEAFLTFGKGRHPAKLNFGDCMTYAIAKVSGQPLLCIGDDFAQTDLEIVPLD